jgi:hypothetical protein
VGRTARRRWPRRRTEPRGITIHAASLVVRGDPLPTRARRPRTVYAAHCPYCREEHGDRGSISEVLREFAPEVAR